MKKTILSLVVISMMGFSVVAQTPKKDQPTTNKKEMVSPAQKPSFDVRKGEPQSPKPEAKPASKDSRKDIRKDDRRANKDFRQDDRPGVCSCSCNTRHRGPHFDPRHHDPRFDSMR